MVINHEILPDSSGHEVKPVGYSSPLSAWTRNRNLVRDERDETSLLAAGCHVRENVSEMMSSSRTNVVRGCVPAYLHWKHYLASNITSSRWIIASVLSFLPNFQFYTLDLRPRLAFWDTRHLVASFFRVFAVVEVVHIICAV